MIGAAAGLLVVAWLPGAVIFRLPVAERERRAALPAEERLFWQVILGISVSLTLALALAAIHQYTFERLLAADILLSAFLAAAARFRLRLGGAPPTWTALVVIGIVALGVWRFLPPSEYIIGGKDPGTYMNEGIVMAQRGTLVYHDPAVASVPAELRELFFAAREEAEHWGSRFMGFPILDLDTGAVVGQFPHLFPASIAVGYGLYGLTGARHAVGFWAVLGLVAVYFAGSRLLGRTVAAAAVALLAVHVIELWFGRYPNAEVVMQALLFGALLANARAHVDGDRFFAPVAALLLVLLLFLRIDTVLAVGAVLAANGLASLRGQRLHWTFLLVLAAGVAVAIPYYAGPMRAYAFLPTQFVLNLQPWHRLAFGSAAVILLATFVAGRQWPALGRRATEILPGVVSIALCALALYALFFRVPEGKLAIENAFALRMYAAFYVTTSAVIAALVGFVLVSRQWFWRDSALLLTIAFFAVFFFFKIRIVPEHFWAARRFLPVILPGTLLFACAAAAWGLRQQGWRRAVSGSIGIAFVLLLGNHYLRAAQPVVEHIEYAGVIKELESLAGLVGDNELLLVESRDAGSDAHVFGLPLAYVYARNVLVLAGARPEPALFAPFLEWARTRYGRIYFLGGGGTDLLSRHWSARPVSSQRFQVPEYESSLNALPRTIRRKEFDFGLYELLPPSDRQDGAIELDVGIRDDLHVVRFHAKEVSEGRTIRWSQRQSFISLPDMPRASREVVIEMNAGGRPPGAPPAEVTLFLDERPLGSVHVGDGFKAYAFVLPPEVAEAASASERLPRLRLVTTVWNPHVVLGSPDDRELGVMVDRVQVR
jgi:hypothetical protein